jgi:biopolymer transport protein ExbD
VRRRLRRRHSGAPEDVNITAFMNLMVILVPFLLITAVFSRLTILELNLPASAAPSADNKQELQLEITIRPDALEVGERRAGVLQRIEKTSKGHNLQALSDALRRLKERFPDKTNATILLEPDSPYDTLVQVMDTVRMFSARKDGVVTRYELFPDISVGDAPVRTAMGGRAS